MPQLESYDAFDGLHWETGTVCNALAYQGVTAPHTGEPYTEALLLGISGGVVLGYFTFAYEGHDPHVALLTRNTFDPLPTLLDRLGVARDVRQTTSTDKGRRNLLAALEEGAPAIVWADMYSLPYNHLPPDASMWAMFPLLVYGYAEGGLAHVADRAQVGLTAPAAALDAARGRVKKDRFRLVTLSAPDADKLPAAVHKGLWDCIRLYTEAPPKGSRNNFGLQAFTWWAEQLSNPRARMSWAKEFPPGRKLYAGLLSTFERINTFGFTGHAERATYAAFLDEAAIILARPALHAAADHFRRSAAAWDALSGALLPDAVPPFKEARALILQRHTAFITRGNAALDDLVAIDARLAAIRDEISADFPLSEAEATALCAGLAEHVVQIRAIEAEAVAAMQAALT